MRMTIDETSRFVPTNQINAVLSRRLFVKSAALAAILGGARPEVLMAETKEGKPHRGLGHPLKWLIREYQELEAKRFSTIAKGQQQKIAGSNHCK